MLAREETVPEHVAVLDATIHGVIPGIAGRPGRHHRAINWREEEVVPEVEGNEEKHIRLLVIDDFVVVMSDLSRVVGGAMVSD